MYKLFYVDASDLIIKEETVDEHGDISSLPKFVSGFVADNKVHMDYGWDENHGHLESVETIEDWGSNDFWTRDESKAEAYIELTRRYREMLKGLALDDDAVKARRKAIRSMIFAERAK